MNGILIALLVVVVLAVVLVAWVIGLYNGLVVLKNRFKNAFAQIDVQLRRRYDLIPNLVETAKGYLKHERETLTAVIEARNQAGSNGFTGVLLKPITLEKLQKLQHIVIDLLEAAGKTGVRRCRNDAAVNEPVAVFLRFQRAEADGGDARVDPQNSHAITLLLDSTTFGHSLQPKRAFHHSPGSSEGPQSL